MKNPLPIHRRAVISFVVAAASAALAPVAALAQSASSYPERTIRLVVPYPAGGSADTVARGFAQQLSARVGQSIIIDNKPGASGNIGTLDVMRAKADGYTLLFNPSIHSVNPELMEKPPYRAIEDFTPISLVARGPLVLIVTPHLQAQNLKEFVELARAKPKSLSFATSVIGSASHLAEELFNRVANADILIVPYKGNAPALTDLMGGQVTAMFDPAVTSIPLVRSGKVRALAVTGKTRLASAPEIPTTFEQGLTDLNIYTWYGLFAPAGLPADIAAKLEASTRQVAATAEFRNSMTDKGLEAVGDSRAEFLSFLQSEAKLYRSIIKQSSIKPQ
jgi:tripartite-type tricarboxylate transporter receptor subunit TctC